MPDGGKKLDGTYRIRKTVDLPNPTDPVEYAFSGDVSAM